MSAPYLTLFLVAIAIAVIALLARRRAQVVEADDPPAPDEAADARRFARELVTDIFMYNEKQVEEGRRHRDLYARLRSDIDRSRELYERRVRPVVRAESDYFADALVDILADGDAEALAGYDDRGGSTLVH